MSNIIRISKKWNLHNNRTRMRYYRVDFYPYYSISSDIICGWITREAHDERADYSNSSAHSSSVQISILYNQEISFGYLCKKLYIALIPVVLLRFTLRYTRGYLMVCSYSDNHLRGKSKVIHISHHSPFRACIPRHFPDAYIISLFLPRIRGFFSPLLLTKFMVMSYKHGATRIRRGI